MANPESTDVEKQERQKTVIAFVAGLLIGGLLVWVFTSAGGAMTGSEGQSDDTDTPDDSGMMEDSDGAMMDDTDADDGDTMVPSQPSTPQMTDGEGTLSVNDQPAGTEVALANVSYPTTAGWIVVREYQNGEGGRILGAARYDTTVGLTPASVTLLRSTEVGGVYMAVFYSENGDRIFDTSSDLQMEGTASAVFEAQ